MKSRNLMLFAAVLGFAAALMFSVVSSQAAESAKKGKALVVSEGKSVKVEYTLTVDGKVIDSSKDVSRSNSQPAAIRWCRVSRRRSWV
jgi:FKBP-type peptidyl-prolyl cis-trans isomerase